MDEEEKTPLSGDLWFDLEEELGTIKMCRERCPGVYHICVDQGDPLLREYFVVLETAPVAGAVWRYGRKLDGLRLYPLDDAASGWQVVQYELYKYQIGVQGKPVPEWLFRQASLQAMERHPEYFGMFPVPFHTPHGYTLRSRTLDNGIYWLETSVCSELLAVCHPVWSAELSFAARMLCEEPVRTMNAIQEKATDYMFFSKEVSCIPIYELMAARRGWDGTIIHRPALMNAIWECLPRYALYLNGEPDPEFEATIAALMNDPALRALPRPDKRHMIYMYPDVGTDFLDLR